MKERILIVEDQFIEANNLQLILNKAGYDVCGIARSVETALQLIEKQQPTLVLLDILLKGDLTGIDLAHMLKKKNIAFVYLSANSNKEILEKAKETHPYGFLVKPFREKDVLVMLEIANYQHKHSLQSLLKEQDQTTPDPQNFHGIIGKSKKLATVIKHLRIVAPTDTSVLILGESGTGKERIAECIHEQSARKMKPLVKVNCGALPATLIESILFGHEKGAFTGATERRIGKFEQAQGGTIFLDEIGELAADVQVKLLRVLQEKEVERIGGSSTIKVNVRIIAATNRNLEEEIARGRFRMDLYYRLNVFPLHLPPLRDRQEDIPLLAEYFLENYARKMGLHELRFSPAAIQTLVNNNWPGNVRELEHTIERTVLLTEGKVVNQIFLSPGTTAVQNEKQQVKTIEELEREHIISVLAKCNGKVFGKGGAAELLGLNVSTLNSRMKKLGIDKSKLTDHKN
ncbi:sigma-54-dependent transcriptional regulator [Niastella sp. OAS944]|uniref:sigma-54-dependent transcriptional regulator n=1 Tax=Niastella sp. OAS944 TaxID=2664089 RepID=UPI0034836B39|nr:DNA-binding NtrC family response regulator [Chitinophagaceae bacterium OAS944]